ncbi:hypothetical protein K431DRAFT_296236 [Polychaeton citri CBS 116435]|uniref:Lipocalin-like domain-containing protein n=1 Tax=Polychaeton citri CBS 116435 TaxID=1314669 RepID=A0A9P4Q3Q0_9PEZI|nr:hypothetical protein K431DRAFT_296236 [Polychaeton citri CBS 116435]
MVSTRAISLFAGAWSLVNNTRTFNGAASIDATYGDKPAGIIYYMPSGFMSAILTTTNPAERPENLTLPYQPNQSDAEWAQIGRHTLAYAGPFDVNTSSIEEFSGEMTGELTHGPLNTATLPAFVGSYQLRQFHFSQNYTLLSLTGDLGGGIVDHLIWQRLDRET